ncbi:MAG TPA: class I SAM-dependent methyltransferase [Candidatus Dormibacteraeota bacterium]|nr:class I SAM-dependent methyltransferase [Candidatus Dormibacteraeota bacterium]
MQTFTERGNMIREPDTRTKDERAGTKSCPLCKGGATQEFLRAPDRFHLRREVYKLMRCAECGCVWLADPPTPAEMGAHYSEDYHRAIAKAGETAAEIRWRRHNELISQYQRGGSILDIGCSSGAFLGTLKGNWKLYGIEMERATAERARAATGADVFVGDVMDAPFAPGSFDAITCFDLLEHVYDPSVFLARVLEWLKPGGMVFVMLPNIESWEARAFGSYWYGLELPRHTFHFSPGSLRYVMGSLGFREVHLQTPPITYVERSLGYLGAAGLEKLGLEAAPQSRPKPAGIPKRILRKALRVGCFGPLGAIESLAGAAGSMEAVFRKPPIKA